MGVPPDSAIEALYRRARSGLAPARPTLVGRAVELASIEALLADDAALPRLVVIRGPSGIGKTELARELCRRALAADWVTGCVTADDPNDGYATVAALLERLIEGRREVVDQLDAAVRARLAHLIPRLGSNTPSMPMTRHRVIGVAQRLLSALARDAGCLVVVDDLECADASSLEVLGLLTEGCQGRLIVCLVHREPASGRVASALARAARLQPTITFELGPLEPPDARTLARQVNPAIDPGRLDELVAKAEGIPLFLAELAAARSSGVVAGLPGALLERLVDLTGVQVDSLRRLALVTEPVNLADVLAVCNLAENETESFLDAALASGILVVADSGYRFRHGLVRSLLAGQLPPHQRASVHRLAARRLVKLGGPPGRIAEHWAQGRRPASAADWFTVAARDAITAGANTAALTFVDAALAQVPRHPAALQQRATVLDALGDIRPLGAFDAAIEVADTTEIDDLRSLQALAQIKLGDAPGALRIASEVEPRTLPAQLARALTFSGAALLGAAGPEVGSRLSAEGRRLALRAGDPAAVVVASWVQAAAAHARGELRSSLFADLEDTRSLPGLAVNVFDGQLCITQRLLYGDRPYDDVIRFTDRFRTEATRLGASRAVAFATTLRGEAELLSGRLDASEQDLREGADRHDRLAAATGESFSYQRLAELANARGDRESALRLLGQALAIARDSEVGFHLFDRIYGTRITLAQDPEEGRDLLLEAEEAVRGPFETCPGCRVTLAVPAAIAAARAGDFDRLVAWEKAAAYLVKVVVHLPAWDAALEEVRGFSALAREDLPEAASHFVDAAARFARAEHPLDARRCGDQAASIVSQSHLDFARPVPEGE